MKNCGNPDTILNFNYLTTTYIFLMLVVVSACHRPKSKTQTPNAVDSTIAVTPPVIPTTDSANLVKIPTEDIKIAAIDVDFKYLTSKSKISFKSKDQNIDNASVNIRIRKDSIIWINVSQYAIEGVRAIIRTDSLFVLDKIHREYYAYDFASLSKQFNFNLSFGLIQSMLVGNMPIPKKPGQRFHKEKDYFMLKQEEGKVLVENYIGEENKRLKKLLVVEQPTKNSLTLDYDDFTSLNSYLFPYSSLIRLDYQSQQDQQFYQTVFSIKHQKIELPDKPLTFPFVIPASYTRK
jgi:Domain of unknown function (DUF4292)